MAPATKNRSRRARKNTNGLLETICSRPVDEQKSFTRILKAQRQRAHPDLVIILQVRVIIRDSNSEHVILSFFGWVQFDASNAVMIIIIIIIISIKSKAMNLLVEVVFYYKYNIGNRASSIYMFSRSHSPAFAFLIITCSCYIGLVENAITAEL